MYKILSDITELREEMKTMDSKDDRKKCKGKADSIVERMGDLMNDTTELKQFLLKQLKKDKQKLEKGENGATTATTATNGTTSPTTSPQMSSPSIRFDAEDKINAIVNRIDDLQQNLADLQHDFGKSSEIIVDRDELLGSKGRKLEDARKEHENADQNLFEL